MVKNASAEQICSFTCRVLTCLRCTRDQWRNGRVSGCPVTGGPRTLGAPDKNDHKKFDSTFLGFLQNCFNLGGKYNISGKFLGVSGKFFSYLGKIGVCAENFFDCQNGTLTENFLATGGGGRRIVAKGGQKWLIDGGPPAVALRHCTRREHL